jgi:lipopolysaccharide/colanic/teichoic acid biosynthesis glycosyltransferase
VLFEQLLPVLLSFGLLLSISTSFRMAVFPVGPGVLILVILALIGVAYGKLWRHWKMPVVLGLFLNVFKGDMSIVGPRPERPMFVEQFKNEIPDHMKKPLVKAGITGWALVHGWRGDSDLKTRIEFDLFYVENWSGCLDLKIMFLTIFKGFLNKNAR